MAASMLLGAPESCVHGFAQARYSPFPIRLKCCKMDWLRRVLPLLALLLVITRSASRRTFLESKDMSLALDNSKRKSPASVALRKSGLHSMCQREQLESCGRTETAKLEIGRQNCLMFCRRRCAVLVECVWPHQQTTIVC